MMTIEARSSLGAPTNNLRSQLRAMADTFISKISGHKRVFKDKDIFDYYIQHENALILVKFGAEWCGACKKCQPQLKQLKEKYRDVIFSEIDVNHNEDIANEREVSSLPTFIFFLGGKEVRRRCGFNEKQITEDLECFLKDLINDVGMFNILSKGNFSYMLEHTRGLVVFWATSERCPSCTKIGPLVHKICKKYQNVTVCKVDVNISVEVAIHLGVEVTPSFFLFRDGKLLTTQTGGSNLERLVKKYRRPDFHANEVVLLKNSKDFQAAISDKKQVRVVYMFESYKPPWHTSDLRMSGVANRHMDWKVYKLDLQKSPRLKIELKIETVPSVLVYIGEKMNYKVGLKEPRDIKRLCITIEENAKSTLSK